MKKTLIFLTICFLLTVNLVNAKDFSAKEKEKSEAELRHLRACIGIADREYLDKINNAIASYEAGRYNGQKMDAKDHKVAQIAMDMRTLVRFALSFKINLEKQSAKELARYIKNAEDTAEACEQVVRMQEEVRR
ncbi:MAG: hypothetical protein NTX45_25330 [Proteobacteria bacterium]|nr:hypothetical protein [Pseudomonadota bacterium]